MKLSTLFTLLFAGITLAAGIDRRANPTYCNRDNCFRAVAGTAKPGHPIIASNDCKTILAGPTTPPVALPTYASACSGFVRYSSACSCLGVTGGNFSTPVTTATTISGIITAPSSTYPLISPTAPFTNSTSTSAMPTPSSSAEPTSSSAEPTSLSDTSSSSPTSTTPTSSSAPPAPTCTDTLTDPLNCGECGTVCDSGKCENGICTSNQCTAQTCGGFTNCNSNSNCFCFSSSNGNNGFCGGNAVCATLTACASDLECNVTGSSGNICAIDTCCPEPSTLLPGVCLEGSCGNPSAKLMMDARARRFVGRADTAAYRA